MLLTKKFAALALVVANFVSLTVTAPTSSNGIKKFSPRAEGDEYGSEFPDGTLFTTTVTEVVAPDTTIYGQTELDTAIEQMKNGFNEGYAAGFDGSMSSAKNDEGTLYIDFELFDGVALNVIPLEAWLSVIEEFRTIVPEEGFPQYMAVKVSYDDDGEGDFKDINTFTISFVIETPPGE